MNYLETGRVGFTYTIEHIRNGEVIDSEVAKNIVPTEGLDYMLNALFKGSSVYSSWYVALYEGNYVPVAGATIATLPANAVETTAYSEANRVAFVPGTVSSGSVDNTSSKAEFTFTASKTIYGGFIASSVSKSATSGVAISAVRFTNPKQVSTGDVLRVTAGLTLSSN